MRVAGGRRNALARFVGESAFPREQEPIGEIRDHPILRDLPGAEAADDEIAPDDAAARRGEALVRAALRAAQGALPGDAVLALDEDRELRPQIGERAAQRADERTDRVWAGRDVATGPVRDVVRREVSLDGVEIACEEQLF